MTPSSSSKVSVNNRYPLYDGYVHGWWVLSLHEPPRAPSMTAVEILRDHGGHLLAEVHQRGRAPIPGEQRARRPAATRIRRTWLRDRLIVAVFFLPILLWVAVAALALRRARWPVIRGSRTVHAIARRIGSCDGHLVGHESGAGVFGTEPYWLSVSTLRQGTPNEVTQALRERMQAVGYQSDANGAYRVPDASHLPAVRLDVIAEGGPLADGSVWFAYPRRHPVLLSGATGKPRLVWAVSGGLAGPGTAVPVGGRKMRYGALAPPIVPPGFTGIRISFSQKGDPPGGSKPETTARQPG